MGAIDAYRRFRETVSQRVKQLEEIHAENLVCRPGCCGCCVNLTVFPVEFDAIAEELRGQGAVELTLDEAAPCAFLRDGRCSIYPLRPIICRTHGLPVAFLNEAAEEPEMSVSFCPLNFADATEDQLSFGEENTLNLDELNESLRQINQAYLAENPAANANGPRIPLIKLREAINDKAPPIS